MKFTHDYTTIRLAAEWKARWEGDSPYKFGAKLNPLTNPFEPDDTEIHKRYGWHGIDEKYKARFHLQNGRERWKPVHGNPANPNSWVEYAPPPAYIGEFQDFQMNPELQALKEVLDRLSWNQDPEYGMGNYSKLTLKRVKEGYVIENRTRDEGHAVDSDIASLFWDQGDGQFYFPHGFYDANSDSGATRLLPEGTYNTQEIQKALISHNHGSMEKMRFRMNSTEIEEYVDNMDLTNDDDSEYDDDSDD